MNTDQKFLQILSILQEHGKQLSTLVKEMQTVKTVTLRTNTAIKVLGAGQEDIRGNMATKAEVEDLSRLGRTDKKLERRIDNLEEHVGISDPHKN